MGYVLQITDTTGGGAGRATTRLHQGLMDIGVDSRILCRENPADIGGVHSLHDTVAKTPGAKEGAAKWAKINDRIATSNRTSISNTIISLGYPGYDISKLPIVRDAEVLHLHWTPRLLSIRGIEQLLRLGKPTYWTQHDRWPTTMGYHFQASEDDFAAPDGATTHLLAEYRLSQLLLEDKRNSFDYPNLHIVCLTDQLADLYRSRSIFTERAVSSVANGIETDLFHPFSAGDRMRARSTLGVSPDAIVLLMLSQNGQEKRKGYAHVAEALRAADDLPSLARARDEDRLMVATIGAGGSADAFPGLRTLPINTISDDEMLITAMNACDALVMPSEQESFSLSVLESLSCGLPVITFGHGGMPEKEIRTGENGVLIDGKPNPRRLAQALDLFCSDDFDRAGCRIGARRTAEQFDVKTVAESMLDIYRKTPGVALTRGGLPDEETLNAPQIKHAAPYDVAPSDWLGRQPVEEALALLFASAAHKTPPKAQRADARRPTPKPAAEEVKEIQPLAMDGKALDLLPLLRLSPLAERAETGGIAVPSRGTSGHVVFGPYISPLPGIYELAVDIETRKLPLKDLLRSRRPLLIEAALNASIILGQQDFRGSTGGDHLHKLSLKFELSEEDCADFVAGLEFRLWTDGVVAMDVMQVTLTRWDANSALLSA